MIGEDPFHVIIKYRSNNSDFQLKIYQNTDCRVRPHVQNYSPGTKKKQITLEFKNFVQKAVPLTCTRTILNWSFVQRSVFDKSTHPI